MLGLLGIAQRDGARAVRLLAEALSTYRAIESKDGMVDALAAFGGAALLLGAPASAARLLAAQEMGREAIRYPVRSSHRRMYDRTVAAVRSALDEEAFTAAWSAGRALMLDEAVGEALALAQAGVTQEDTPQHANGRLSNAAAGPASHSGLSARELEVLRLLAAGRSNREIAETLVLSVRTVVHHVEHIYAKIGARKRADAVAYALRRGLTGDRPADRT
jgi:DNA-binding CsgD family transcriptional regulator